MILYVCVNYWGKGATLDEAKKKARKAGARKDDMKIWMAYECPDDGEYSITEFGGLEWPAGTEKPKVIDGSENIRVKYGLNP